MIDLSNLRAPGWGRVVADLTAAAPDDKSFLERLLAVMTQVSAARQGVLWVAERREGDEVDVRVSTVWPIAPGLGGGGAPADGAASAFGNSAETVEQIEDARASARAVVASGQPRTYGLDNPTGYYDAAPGKGYVLAVPVPGTVVGGGGSGAGAGGGGAGMVITLLVEPRSREAVRSTMAMAEVLAGYVHGHATRQALRRTQQASFALDLAAKLIASVNTAPTFKGASMQLCNDIAKGFGVDRVAMGWVKGLYKNGQMVSGASAGDVIRVEAISDTEHFDRRMAMVQKLKAAMEECLDQEQPVMYPAPPAEADVLLNQAISHAHRELAASDAKLKVCSLPLRIDEQVVGVLTIESGGDGAIDLGTVELIQSALDLVAPVLRIRRSDDRILPLRACDSAVSACAWAVGPKHTVWKAAAIALLALTAFVTFYQTTYRIGAEAVLEPATRRIISAPFDAQIARLGEQGGRPVEPGVRVEAGDVLVELDATEWRLSLADARAKIVTAEAQESAALRENDAGKAAQARAQRERAQADYDIFEYRINRSTIRAPISGTILGGRLTERVGSSVRIGDALFEIAPLDDMVVVAKVDDRDITLIKRAYDEAVAAGREPTGAIATKANPGASHGFVVDRIVPLATAADGKNVFEVRARLTQAEEWMRPGMEARAKFDTQRHSLLWIGSRRIVDTVRLWLW